MALRLTHTETSTDKVLTAKIYRNSDWQEFRVKFYRDGKYQSDYHTDDKEDAKSTARHFCNEKS